MFLPALVQTKKMKNREVFPKNSYTVNTNDREKFLYKIHFVNNQ